jgi:translation initiation factor 1
MARMTRDRLVYSTSQGRLCPECGRPIGDCRCRRSRPATTPTTPSRSGDGIVRVSRETQGRKGKGVTVVRGVPLTGDALQELATKLKKRCGSGGTVTEDHAIEIQGEHRDVLVAELGKLGYLVRRAGG